MNHSSGMSSCYLNHDHIENISAHNSLLYPQHMPHSGTWLPQHYQMGYSLPHTNRFVYVKQNFIPPQPEVLNTTVHINPNFNKKVFVNPNFQRNVGQQPPVTPKIHINPNSSKINIDNQSILDRVDKVKKIHVNPNILRTIPIPAETKNSSVTETSMSSNKIVYSSRTKLIRKPDKLPSTSRTPKTRRKSICSKYKIIKSHLLKKKFIYDDLKTKTKLKSPMKHNFVRTKLSQFKKNSQYKVDNRLSKVSDSKRLASQIKRNTKINVLKYKTSNIVRIDNVLYRKSLHTLRKTSYGKKFKNTIISKTPPKTISKSRYKIVRRKSLAKEQNNAQNTLALKRSSSKTKLRLTKVKKAASPGKLKTCNIPCYIYRKFGRCKAQESGKCFRKHDPDQIALCTKFLQGACLNDKCLLSHNVSPEKMPTCKYYLEGTCSKDKCPYLHVRISPKADICKDFLEGFCKMANECDKRHQFLCPDYEKHGKCLKQRCPYPHGRMVRKYSVFHSDKFAKKSSDKKSNVVNDIIPEKTMLVGHEEIAKCDDADEIIIKTRYYIESKLTSGSVEKQTAKPIEENQFDLQCRPKLGNLPSFIAFEDS